MSESLSTKVTYCEKLKFKCKENGYQVTVHELLHLLGLDHCIYFACLMNGSGSLEEDHRQADAYFRYMKTSLTLTYKS